MSFKQNINQQFTLELYQNKLKLNYPWSRKQVNSWISFSFAYFALIRKYSILKCVLTVSVHSYKNTIDKADKPPWITKMGLTGTVSTPLIRDWFRIGRYPGVEPELSSAGDTIIVDSLAELTEQRNR